MQSMLLTTPTMAAAVAATTVMQTLLTSESEHDMQIRTVWLKMFMKVVVC